MKDLRRGYVGAESPLKTSCSGTQTRQGAVSAHVAVCTSLKPFAVSEMFHLALRKRGDKKKKIKQQHTRARYKHIRVDGWTARQPLSARFRFYVTVTYMQCSVQRHFLNLWRRRHKGQDFVCRQPPSAFLPGRKTHIQGKLTSLEIFRGTACLQSVSELEWERFILLPLRETDWAKTFPAGKPARWVDHLSNMLKVQ